MVYVGIGFTGTQQGITNAQHVALEHEITVAIHRCSQLWGQNARTFNEGQFTTRAHHGDCVGADLSFDLICQRLGLARVIHPPLVEKKRAHCERTALVGSNKTPPMVMPPLDYLDRNKAIVHESWLLIAAPKEFTEQTRSGTWSTVRYARKLRREVHVILPDGVVLIEPNNV